MPPVLPLTHVSGADLRRIKGLPKETPVKTTFPKALRSPAEHRAAFKRWQTSVREPAVPKNPEVRVRAVKPTPVQLARLRAVFESPIAPAEALKQRMAPEELFGTLYSALAAYQFMRMESEYRKRRASARARESVDEQWSEVVRAGQTAMRVAGLTVSAQELSSYAKNLAGSKATLESVANMVNRARAGVGGALDGRTAVVATIVPTVEAYLDPTLVVTGIADLCTKPISQGSFTKHIARGISLCVRITYWCPTWTNPFRTCTTTVCAGASFSLNLSVGYKIDCCGASAWGVAYAQACASIAGLSVCAACSASITGVAGVSRTPTSGGQCNYGLGIVASLRCTFAGFTVYSGSYGFGWTVTGPCPPPGLCP